MTPIKFKFDSSFICLAHLNEKFRFDSFLLIIAPWQRQNDGTFPHVLKIQ